MVQGTKSRKHTSAVKTKKAPKRIALSVADIRNRFKEMDVTIRDAVKNGLKTPESLGKHVSNNWSKLFKKPLSSKAAVSLAQHYLNLHGKKKGGSLSGSPLDYVMRPGLPAVAAYATFPTEVGTDPQSVRALDVYYNSALGRSCGIENTSATPLTNIGTNVVPPPARGGALAAVYSTNQRIIKGGKRSTKRNNRKSGGDFMTALSSRQYIGANPAGPVQRASESWMGVPTNPHDISDPTSKGWNFSMGPQVMIPYLPSAPGATSALASHPKIQGLSAVPS